MGAAAVFDVKSVGGDSRDLSKQDQSLVPEVAMLKSQLFRYENIKDYPEQLMYMTGVVYASSCRPLKLMVLVNRRQELQDD